MFGRLGEGLSVGCAAEYKIPVVSRPAPFCERRHKMMRLWLAVEKVFFKRRLAMAVQPRYRPPLATLMTMRPRMVFQPTMARIRFRALPPAGQSWLVTAALSFW